MCLFKVILVQTERKFLMLFSKESLQGLEENLVENLHSGGVWKSFFAPGNQQR